MGALLFLLVGAAAGLIATRLMRVEAGLAQTIALGVLGAAVGLGLMRLFLATAPMASGLVGAIIGACAVIWAWRMWRGRR